MNKKYNIFISYRRDGGQSTAKMLYDKLNNLGYKVFFDVESLLSGNFNTALYSVIDECKDFLLILSPGALDRCENENDWIRLEIEHALEQGLNIIPIMLRGFSFPENLPPSIDDIRYKNGIESNYQFFDAFIAKLQTFLKSDCYDSKHKKNKYFLATGTLIVAFFCIALAIWFAVGRQKGSYPKTNYEKNITKNLIYYLETNLQQLELASEYLDKSYQTCNEYLEHINTASRSALLAELYNNKSGLEQIDTDYSLMSDDLQEKLKDSPFSLADAIAMHDYLIKFIDSNIDRINFIEVVTDESSFVDTNTLEKLISNYQEILEEELKSMAYSTNELLLVVENEDILVEFKYKFLPELYYIKLQASNWSYDAKTLESDSEKSWNTIQKIENRIISLIGNTNMEVMQFKSELIQQLVAEGASYKEAELLVEELNGKIQLVTEEKLTVQELQQELKEKYNEARKKFAPSSEDDSGILWGKMLRFMSLSLYDEAIECIEVYREKVRGEDEYAEVYCAAAVCFIRNISKTGINYGVMVVGYDPEQPFHEQYKVGDVIISINGSPCHNYEEYSQFRMDIGENQNFSVVVLREDDENAGKLKQMKLDIPADAPKVKLINMSEKKSE